MKAIVQRAYGGTEVLSVTDVDPPAIGPSDALVRVRAAGVDPGVWHLVAGLPYMVRLMGFGLRAPKNPTPGMDVAGVVERVGDAVTRLHPGDEVFGTATGSFAELTRADEKKLAHKPASLGFEEAAALPVSGTTALQAVRDKGQVKEGQRVAVLGAGGGVGHLAVQIAKAFGAEVTGVCSTARVDFVAQLGVDRVVDRTREDFASVGPFDVIVDAAGRRPLSQLRRALTSQGTLVLVGGEGGNRWTGGFERQLAASVASPFLGHNLRAVIAKDKADDLEVLAGLIDEGKLRPVVDRTFPLADAAKAIEYMHSGAPSGKVVLTV
jgi:NADPH:quinone reductase-like Zn-dependent oxidoreductase